MDRVAGKVAFITGAARGMGRAHAVRLAEEGADIIAVDLPTQSDDYQSFAYKMSTAEDVEETVALVEDLGRQIVFCGADIRDRGLMREAVNSGMREFGRIDIVVANAGGDSPGGPSWELPEQAWDEVMDTNLKGTWNTLSVTIPPMIEAGMGGSIVIMSSGAGLMGVPNLAHYSASKHGLSGLMKSVANEVAPYFIRVNAVCPTMVDTTMIQNETIWKVIRPDLEHPTREDVIPVYKSMNLLPEPWVEPRDVSNAVLWLASDEARYVTGVSLPVDLGTAARSTRPVFTAP